MPEKRSQVLTFLMTPAQHRHWARILHSRGKPRESAAARAARRAIKIIERRRQWEHTQYRRLLLVVVLGPKLLLLLDDWLDLLSGRRWRGHFGKVRAQYLFIC